MVLVAAVATIVVVVAAAAWRGRAAGTAAGRPLPVTRRAAGWRYGAEHPAGDHSRLHWILTYRGEAVAAGGTLITPLGTLGAEPSRPGDSGDVLDVSRNSRTIPVGGETVTLAVLTSGYHASDCTTKPRGMPPDWSCRPNADEPGWIAPSILFGDRFRVEAPP